VAFCPIPLPARIARIQPEREAIYDDALKLSNLRFPSRPAINCFTRHVPVNLGRVSSLDGNLIPPKEGRFTPRALKLWSVLASICVAATILLANAFPLSWVAVWPRAFSVLPVAVLLFLSSLRIIASVEKLILAGRWMFNQSRRHSQPALGTSTPSLNEKLDGVSQELEELRRIAEELDWRVGCSPAKPSTEQEISA